MLNPPLPHRPAPTAAPGPTSEARLRAVWASAVDAFVLSDPDGRVLDVNPAYCALYGYRREELIGRSFAVIFPPERRDEAEAQYRALFAAGRPLPAFEATIQRRDGEARVVEARADFVREAGAPTALLSIVRDITDRKRAEMEQARLYREAQAALAARDGFFATVSHDLKNPLTAIRGIAQLLQQRAERLPPPEAGWFSARAATILRASTTMVGLIDELLDLARLQAGQPLELRRWPTDLVAFAHEAVATHRERAREHHLEFVARVPELVATVDADRLARVLDNLLSNAVKYSPGGGTITVTLDQDADQAVLTVRDTGIGIPTADLPRVFERFYRASNVPAQVTGSGLGLAGVRQIVEQHGGRVAIASQTGIGTTVTIHLPLAASPDLAAEPAPA